MGKKDKNKKKGIGAQKTLMKTEKKLATKQKKLLEKLGESDIVEVVASLEAEQGRLKAISEDECAPPSPRSNFSIVSHPEKEVLIIFGGEFFNGQNVVIYNDLFFYNISKNKWTQLRSPSGPLPRSGHQMLSLGADGGQLWLFGGEYASPSQLQFYHYKDLWVMSLKTRKWDKINAPNGPSARSGHRMVAGKNRLIVFGGFHDNNQSYRYFNDVHIFSLETYTWLQIEVGGALTPQPRSGCCMSSLADGRILVWGGYSKSQLKKSDRGITHTDMFILSPDKNKPNEKFTWSKAKTSGYKPLPRSSVGFTSSVNDKVYCFGGVMDVDEDEEDVKGQFGSELTVLDTKTLTWHLVQMGKKVSPREQNKKEANSNAMDQEPSSSANKHTNINTDDTFTLTVGNPNCPSSGNVDMHEGPSGSLSKGQILSPSARMSPGICVCKGKLYLYGGLFEKDSKQYTLNDFYAIDLNKRDEWKVLIANDQNSHEWIDSDEDSDSEEDENSGSSDDDDDDDDSDEDSEMDTD